MERRSSLLAKMATLVACFAAGTSYQDEARFLPATAHSYGLQGGGESFVNGASRQPDIPYPEITNSGDKVGHEVGYLDARNPSNEDTGNDEIFELNLADEEPIDPYWRDDPEEDDPSAYIQDAVDGILKPEPEAGEAASALGNADAYWEDDSTEEVSTIGYVEITTPPDCDAKISFDEQGGPQEGDRRVRGRPHFLLKWRGEAAIAPPGEMRRQQAEGCRSAEDGAAETETVRAKLADVKCICKGRKVADEHERDGETECESTRKLTEPRRLSGIGSRRSRLRRHDHENARTGGEEGTEDFESYA